VLFLKGYDQLLFFSFVAVCVGRRPRLGIWIGQEMASFQEPLPLLPHASEIKTTIENCCGGTLLLIFFPILLLPLASSPLFFFSFCLVVVSGWVSGSMRARVCKYLLFNVTNEAIEWRASCRGWPDVDTAAASSSCTATAAAGPIEFHAFEIDLRRRRCWWWLWCATFAQTRLSASFKHLKII